MSIFETEAEVCAKVRELLSQFADVRTKYAAYPNVRRFQLWHQHLQEYQPFGTAIGLGLEGTNPPSKSLQFNTAGFDVAITLLRYLFGFLQVPTCDADELARDEEEYPLLRLGWADISKGEQADTRKRLASQYAVRYLLFRQLQIRRPNKDTFSFLEVMENEEMWQRLWSRQPFCLLHPEVWFRTAEGGNWDKRPLTPTWRLGRHGKLIWDCRGNLGDLVSSQFGFSGGDRPGHLSCKTSGDPVVLRIHMKPSQEHRKKWEDVRRFEYDQLRLEPSPQGSTPVRTKVAVTLIATVHIPRQGPERLRLYKDNLVQLHLGAGMRKYAVEEGEEGVVHLGDSEEGEWMLYYIRAPALQDLPELQRRESTPRRVREGEVQDGFAIMGPTSVTATTQAGGFNDMAESDDEPLEDGEVTDDILANAPTGPRAQRVAQAPAGAPRAPRSHRK